jgi:hypothetical protein
MGWETEIPDVITGEPIESDWGNEVRDKLVHIVASTAALPSDEPDGGVAYVQDKNGLYLRRGSVWLGLPGGHLGTALVTAAQAGITALADVTGATVTVTVPANRRLKITGGFRCSQVTSTGVPQAFIAKDGSGIQQLGTVNALAAGGFAMFHGSALDTPATGSRTYKLQAQTSAGTLTINASATIPTYIVVEDIGPA